MSNIRKLSTVDVSNIQVSDINFAGEDKRYILLELCYKSNNVNDPILLQIDELPIYTYSTDVVLQVDEKTSTFFDTFDSRIMSCVSQSGILKERKLKGVEYKALVNELSVTDTKISVLKLPVTEVTKLFNDNKEKIKNEEFSNKLRKGDTLRSIVHFAMVIIDTVDKTIRNHYTVHQMCVRRRKPLIPVLIEYSFIDEDNETNHEQKSNGENDKENELDENDNELSSSNEVDYESSESSGSENVSNFLQKIKGNK